MRPLRAIDKYRGIINPLCSDDNVKADQVIFVGKVVLTDEKT